METQSLDLPGTIVWVAPFYNRSGYGFGARASVCALHRAGARIRVMPVNEVEEGLDDCDLSLIKSLETTPLIAPITTIVNHVPARAWLGIKLPEPNLRILATTFDGSLQGNLPPAEWIDICKEMDQVWLMVEQERQAFVSAGLSPEKIQLVCWPHPWIDNPVLPPPGPEPSLEKNPFRFLSVAMFQPRRRWDTLIESFFEEFKSKENVELYLKVNYPSWHPVPGKPGQDLHELVGALRRKTGSDAAVVIDEELGTRAGICRLVDSCNVYISTDTAATAPISEARVRRRMVIMPEGVGRAIDMGPERCIGIAEDPEAKYRLTEAMIEYQPHHKGTFMPRLHVRDVRHAMRRAFEMSMEERSAKAAADYVPGPADTNPLIVDAIKAGWRYKEQRHEEKKAKNLSRKIIWEGPQQGAHSPALVNRELCLQLMDSGCELSIIPCENGDIGADGDPRLAKLVERTAKPLSAPADIHIRRRLPPDFTPPAQGRWVMIESWEYGRLPEEWIKPLTKLVDEIWVPSAHVLKTCIACGIPEERVKLVPNGVNSARFYPVAREKPAGQKFRFLFVGALLWRKGIDVLLNSYRKAFRKKDGVVLILKDFEQQVFHRDRTALKILEEMRSDPDSPEVIHYTEMLEPAGMPGLYNACDCLVHPYRAEGFGLPVLEAMACGLPVVVTQGGATDDFCLPEYAFRIPSKRFAFAPGDLRLAEGVPGWVLEPDGDFLSTLLKQVFENQTAARRRALAVSERIRADYDWARIGEKMMARLDSLAGKPIVRNCATKPVEVKREPSPSLCIKWEGSQFVHHSLALVNREICLRLIDSGHELDIIPYEKDQFGPEADPRFGKIAGRVNGALSRRPDVHVRHQWPPDFTPPPEGHWVMIQPWEFGRLPEQWVGPMSALLDEIWVPSRHVLKTYVASGVPSDRVHVVPNGVNTDIFHPGLKPYPLASRKRFKFLFLGGTLWRKGIDVLLEAFRTTFSKNDDVSLIVKDMGTDSFYQGQGAEGTIRAIRNDPAAPELVYMQEMLSDADMPRLLAACDCLVHPYRGEGFALPVLEAMACGLPVITTEGGSTDDFCPPDQVFLIPSVRRECNVKDMRLAGGAGWVLEPDLSALKAILGQVYEEAATARERALKFSEHIRRSYDWKNVAEKVAERIIHISRTPVRRKGRP